MSSSTSAPAAAAALNGRGTSRRAASGVNAAPVRVPGGKPRTPPAQIALCLLLMLGCGAAAGALVFTKDSAITVVAAARDLPAGTVIGPADLRSAQLSGSGLAAIPGGQAGTLLGTTVIGPLPAGTLLNAGMVTTAPAPGPGMVAVGMALTPAQLPVPQLRAGRQVTIFQLPETGRAPGTGAAGPSGGGEQVLLDRAQVLSVMPAANGFLVTLEVAAADAGAVSAASSANRVTLGLLPL